MTFQIWLKLQFKFPIECKYSFGMIEWSINLSLTCSGHWTCRYNGKSISVFQSLCAHSKLTGRICAFISLSCRIAAVSCFVSQWEESHACTIFWSFMHVHFPKFCRIHIQFHSFQGLPHWQHRIRINHTNDTFDDCLDNERSKILWNCSSSKSRNLPFECHPSHNNLFFPCAHECWCLCKWLAFHWKEEQSVVSHSTQLLWFLPSWIQREMITISKIEISLLYAYKRGSSM